MTHDKACEANHEELGCFLFEIPRAPPQSTSKRQGQYCSSRQFAVVHKNALEQEKRKRARLQEALDQAHGAGIFFQEALDEADAKTSGAKRLEMEHIAPLEYERQVLQEQLAFENPEAGHFLERAALYVFAAGEPAPGSAGVDYYPASAEARR